MRAPQPILHYTEIPSLVDKLRADLQTENFVLLFAHNGTGKTRISMAFKEKGKEGGEDKRDTLYYNAFTEDLFSWDNDLESDSNRILRINSSSKFFNGFKELALEERIFTYLERYANFNFKIDYENWHIGFTKGDNNNIKISRGEETIFKWCIFMAICELTIDGAEAYSWVKYIYVDDPISSLDEHNAITVASDLAQLLVKDIRRVKTVISTHHILFFNVVFNELKSRTQSKYFLHKHADESYSLRNTKDTPFFHHVASLSELKKAMDTDVIQTHHFNMLRTILEKTSSFLGYNDFGKCIHGVDDEILFQRALNIMSHGKYSMFEPTEMVPDNKKLFKDILSAFLEKYKFDLPNLLAEGETATTSL